jgi:Cytochrome P460
MIKDSRLYSSTGGSRFERFVGNDQMQDVIHDSVTSCFECDPNAKAHGSVFSQFH